MDTYSGSQQLIQNAIGDMGILADMLGDNDASKAERYGFVPGLNQDGPYQTLCELIDKLKQGIFQVYFTGGFDAGKSTLLNALMRRDVLRVSIDAETSVITKILFNQPEKIVVHFKQKDENGDSQSREMTIAEFFQEYRVDQKDPAKFDNIQYAVLQMNQDGIGGSMVQLVDSPGTGNSQSDTETAQRFVKTADAVVFLINATKPFELADKEYIAAHFAGKQLENIFFVVNRFDSVAKDQVDNLKRNVRNQLNLVFQDKDGKFNEQQFSKRVFYTNAYYSLCSRTNQKVETPFGIFMPEDEKTGVPDFEAALAEYLTADNRDKTALQSYLSPLAGMYLIAKKKINDILDQYSKGIEELIRQKEVTESESERIRGIVQGIRTSCNTAVTNMMLSAKGEYDNTINRIEANWDTYFQDQEIDFGTGKLAQIVFKQIVGKFGDGEAAKRKIEEKLKPVTEAVSKYINIEMGKMGANLEGAISVHINTMKKQLDLYQQQLNMMETPLDFSEICIDLNIDTEPIGTESPKNNLFQMILGIVGADPEIITSGMAGNKSNMQAIIEFIAKNVFEFIALYVVAWPIGVAMLVGRLVQIIRGVRGAGNEALKQILAGIRNATSANLRAQRDKFVMDTESKIGGMINKSSDLLCVEIENQLSSYAKNLEKTIHSIQAEGNNVEIERARTDALLETMRDALDDLYMSIHSEPLTDEAIDALVHGCKL